MTQLSQFVRHDLNYDVTIPLRLRFLANVNVLRITLRLLNAMAIPSVVCLASVVCDVGAPYSGS